MMELEVLLRRDRQIRAIGFDDAPFVRHSGEPVGVAGVVCAKTRFEGMLWGYVQQDGWNATETVYELLRNSKFLPQLHLILLDGIALGGFNVIDLPLLAEKLGLPCVAVMRRMPKLPRVEEAIRRLPQPERRLEILKRAGEIYQHPPFYFQVAGAKPEIIAAVLHRLTDCGHVPEALRLAHLIGAAFVNAESGKQA